MVGADLIAGSLIKNPGAPRFAVAEHALAADTHACLATASRLDSRLLTACTCANCCVSI